MHFKWCKSESGSLSIEFAFIFIALLTLFFFIIEISRIIFISSAIDVSISEAGRYASFDEQKEMDYLVVFKEKLNNDIPMWPLLTSDDKLSIDITYCKTTSDLIEHLNGSNSNKCNRNDPSLALVIYTIRYNYDLLFPGIFPSMANALTRNVVYVQEYKRTN